MKYKCKNKNCNEQGCYSEILKSPLYCEICFWMSRMDKDMVTRLIKNKNLTKIQDVLDN